MGKVLTNISNKTHVKLLSKIRIAQFKNSIPVPEKTHSVCPWIFLSFKADDRLQMKDGTQRTSLVPQKAEVLG